jgi:hypothetical protein
VPQHPTFFQCEKNNFERLSIDYTFPICKYYKLLDTTSVRTIIYLTKVDKIAYTSILQHIQAWIQWLTRTRTEAVLVLRTRTRIRLTACVSCVSGSEVPELTARVRCLDSKHFDILAPVESVIVTGAVHNFGSRRIDIAE